MIDSRLVPDDFETTARVWAAILEHGLQPDGTVRLPEALVPYMGGNTLG